MKDPWRGAEAVTVRVLRITPELLERGIRDTGLGRREG